MTFIRLKADEARAGEQKRIEIRHLRPLVALSCRRSVVTQR
jgi:hypothetical protein